MAQGSIEPSRWASLLAETLLDGSDHDEVDIHEEEEEQPEIRPEKESEVSSPPSLRSKTDTASANHRGILANIVEIGPLGHTEEGPQYPTGIRYIYTKEEIQSLYRPTEIVPEGLLDVSLVASEKSLPPVFLTPQDDQEKWGIVGRGGRRETRKPSAPGRGRGVPTKSRGREDADYSRGYYKDRWSDRGTGSRDRDRERERGSRWDSSWDARERERDRETFGDDVDKHEPSWRTGASSPSRDHSERERDSGRASSSGPWRASGTPPGLGAPKPRDPSELRWLYKDPQGEIQGPFDDEEMMEWYLAGYFEPDLLVKRVYQPAFVPLGQLIKGDEPPFAPKRAPERDDKEVGRVSTAPTTTKKSDEESLPSVITHFVRDIYDESEDKPKPPADTTSPKLPSGKTPTPAPAVPVPAPAPAVTASSASRTATPPVPGVSPIPILPTNAMPPVLPHGHVPLAGVPMAYIAAATPGGVPVLFPTAAGLVPPVAVTAPPPPATATAGGEPLKRKQGVFRLEESGFVPVPEPAFVTAGPPAQPVTSASTSTPTGTAGVVPFPMPAGAAPWPALPVPAGAVHGMGPIALQEHEVKLMAGDVATLQALGAAWVARPATQPAQQGVATTTQPAAPTAPAAGPTKPESAKKPDAVSTTTTPVTATTSGSTTATTAVASEQAIEEFWDIPQEEPAEPKPATTAPVAKAKPAPWASKPAPTPAEKSLREIQEEELRRAAEERKKREQIEAEAAEAERLSKSKSKLSAWGLLDEAATANAVSTTKPAEKKSKTRETAEPPVSTAPPSLAAIQAQELAEKERRGKERQERERTETANKRPSTGAAAAAAANTYAIEEPAGPAPKKEKAPPATPAPWANTATAVTATATKGKTLREIQQEEEARKRLEEEQRAATGQSAASGGARIAGWAETVWGTKSAKPTMSLREIQELEMRQRATVGGDGGAVITPVSEDTRTSKKNQALWDAVRLDSPAEEEAAKRWNQFEKTSTVATAASGEKKAPGVGRGKPTLSSEAAMAKTALPAKPPAVSSTWHGPTAPATAAPPARAPSLREIQEQEAAAKARSAAANKKPKKPAVEEKVEMFWGEEPEPAVSTSTTAKTTGPKSATAVVSEKDFPALPSAVAREPLKPPVAAPGTEAKQGKRKKKKLAGATTTTSPAVPAAPPARTQTEPSTTAGEGKKKKMQKVDPTQFLKFDTQTQSRIATGELHAAYSDQ